MTQPLKQITLYTDGACIGNPGPGGYGVVLLYGKIRKELSGGFQLTTNNRMEMMAAIVGLQALKQKCSVVVYSDSKYLVDAVMLGWAFKWRSKGWMRSKTERAVNADLWQEILKLCEKHQVQFQWVKGHAGNVENERCDQLAVLAAKQPDLPVDVGYRAQQPEQQSALF